MRATARRPRRRRAGLTLVETALLISLAGVVLAVSIPTYFRVVRTSKLAEPPEELRAMHRAAAAYYTRQHPTPEGSATSCIPPAAGPTPAKPDTEPQTVDFHSAETAGSATWRALDYQPSRAIRYRYSLLPAEVGCGVEEPPGDEPLIRLRAEGDLDGDGELSVFERAATLTPDGQLVPEGPLLMRRRIE